jgi:hypothetical protein
MEFIYIPRTGDEDVIADYKKGLKNLTSKELIDDYNKQARLGIVGVHQQALYLIALRDEFKEWFGYSPVYLEDAVLGMKGEVEIVNNKITVLE